MLKVLPVFPEVAPKLRSKLGLYGIPAVVELTVNSWRSVTNGEGFQVPPPGLPLKPVQAEVVQVLILKKLNKELLTVVPLGTQEVCVSVFVVKEFLGVMPTSKRYTPPGTKLPSPLGLASVGVAFILIWTRMYA
jgi:hypothetical protein